MLRCMMVKHETWGLSLGGSRRRIQGYAEEQQEDQTLHLEKI